MSTDFDPKPGLPLLTELFCNSTTVKKKKTINCWFPPELYSKHDFYGGLAGISVGLIELILLLIFIVLIVKMKRDITKYFLTSIFIPLGLSTVFKIAGALYGTLVHSYGYCFVTFLTFFNFFYNAALLSTAIGSIFYLAGMIIVARKRQQFEKSQLWICFLTILMFSILVSASYHFVTQKWNQLPAASIWFIYVLATIGICALIISGLLTLLICSKKLNQAKENAENDAPDISNARQHLAFACLFLVVLNIPHWFEIYVKSTELFTPYLWNSNKEKVVFYKKQAIELLLFDKIRIFLSLLMYISMFLNSSIRCSISSVTHRNQKKIFVATQNVPLLQQQPPPPNEESGKKGDEGDDGKENEKTGVASTNNSLNQIVTPKQPPEYGYPTFSPGFIHFPPNMQTTIVYTPPSAYANGVTAVEELK